MVGIDIITAYRIVDKSILAVANDIVLTDTYDFVQDYTPYRLQEIPYSISERNERLKPVVVAHDLRQYVQKFYNINMKASEVCIIDYLVDIDYDAIDISEFGGKICY